MASRARVAMPLVAVGAMLVKVGGLMSIIRVLGGYLFANSVFDAFGDM
jgi:hypothetical protein